jgi:hypothetical protein
MNREAAMTEAQRIQKANVAGLKAFTELSLTERLKRLEEMGLIDGRGNLAAAYGGTAKPPKKNKKTKRAA